MFFFEKLEHLSKLMKVPIEELWESMGIKKGGFQAMKQRKSNPSYDSLHRLLEKYEQINPDWVLFEKGPELRVPDKHLLQEPEKGYDPEQQLYNYQALVTTVVEQGQRLRSVERELKILKSAN